MPNEDMQQKLKDWFNATGFPLEVETSRAFYGARFGVEHSAVYADQETGKSREIDVLAYTRDASGCFGLFLASECKSSDKPWVVLTHSQQHKRHGALWIASMSAHARKALANHIEDYLQIYEETFGKPSGGYALKQAFSGQSDHAYTACISALKAAAAFVNDDSESISFAIPTIVVNSPIYEYRETANDGQVFTPVQSSSFEFSAHLKDYTRTVIRIVSSEMIGRYADQSRNLADRYEQLFFTETKALLRNDA